jgi:hypothetical protein
MSSKLSRNGSGLDLSLDILASIGEVRRVDAVGRVCLCVEWPQRRIGLFIDDEIATRGVCPDEAVIDCPPGLRGPRRARWVERVAPNLGEAVPCAVAT